jgi:putative oxidoreductase
MDTFQETGYMRILHYFKRPLINHLVAKDYVELGIRIFTGLFLILDGIHIISHSVQLEETLKQAMSVSQANLLINYIGFAHLFAGAFIILGLITRVAIAIQIPAVLAEMYYIQPPNSFLGDWEIIAFTVLLGLLIYLFGTGSGKFSMDYYRKRDRNKAAM